MRCIEGAIKSLDGDDKAVRITPLVFYKCSARLSVG